MSEGDLTEAEFDAWVDAIEAFAEKLQTEAHSLRMQAEAVRRAKGKAMQERKGQQP